MNVFENNCVARLSVSATREAFVRHLLPANHVVCYGLLTGGCIFGWTLAIENVVLADDWETTIRVAVEPIVDDSWRLTLARYKRMRRSTSQLGKFVVLTEKFHCLFTAARVIQESFAAEDIVLIEVTSELPDLFGGSGMTLCPTMQPRPATLPEIRPEIRPALAKHIKGLQKEISDADLLAFDLDAAVNESIARL